MPLAHISVPTALSSDKARALADAVHESLVETCAVPPKDRFQLIRRVAPDEMIIDPSFPDVRRTPEASIVEILLIEGRTAAQKDQLFRRITERAAAAGFVADDLLITVAENARSDWCAGQGRAYSG